MSEESCMYGETGTVKSCMKKEFPCDISKIVKKGITEAISSEQNRFNQLQEKHEQPIVRWGASVTSFENDQGSEARWEIPFPKHRNSIADQVAIGLNRECIASQTIRIFGCGRETKFLQQGSCYSLAAFADYTRAVK